MRCNRCGSENKDGSVFCAFCGGKIATNDNSSTINTPKKVNSNGNDGFTNVFNDNSIQLNNSTGHSNDNVNTVTSNNDFNVSNGINSNINMNTQDSSDTTTDTGNSSSSTFFGTEIGRAHV